MGALQNHRINHDQGMIELAFKLHVGSFVIELAFKLRVGSFIILLVFRILLGLLVVYNVRRPNKTLDCK